MSSASSILGQQVLYDADESALVHGSAKGSHGGGGGGGGGTTPTGTVPPAVTVGSSTGLQFHLVFDSSVANAPSGFAQAITDVATYYSSLFSTKEVINLNVGWGETGGTSMSAGALGQSQSYGYLVNYATATSLLHGYTAASNAPTGSQFFITTAQAKEAGLLSPTSTGIDGFIGFGTLSGTGSSWNTASSGPNSGTGIGSTAGHYDLQSVAQHEISEVMGRIEMEGQVLNGAPSYTTLDLFNFRSPGVLELDGHGGYFSTDNGVHNLGTFNNSSTYGGDIADWASATSPYSSGTGVPSGYQDSYDAFGYGGINGYLSGSDVLVDSAGLGYGLTTLGIAIA
jgi:hypothetical protein